MIASLISIPTQLENILHSHVNYCCVSLQNLAQSNIKIDLNKYLNSLTDFKEYTASNKD